MVGWLARLFISGQTLRKFTWLKKIGLAHTVHAISLWVGSAIGLGSYYLSQDWEMSFLQGQVFLNHLCEDIGICNIDAGEASSSILAIILGSGLAILCEKLYVRFEGKYEWLSNLGARAESAIELVEDVAGFDIPTKEDEEKK